MATIVLQGYYYRTRCVTCRKYFIHRHPRAVTCGALCRQRRCRLDPKRRAYPRASLGYLLVDDKVSGKLAEKCSHTAR